MNENIENLKKSIVYAMSLGSHELFHSNLWAWLMKKDNRYIKIFFEKFEEKEPVRVFREKENMDIRIECGPGKTADIYIIENKFKDMPTAEQLEKYNNKLKNKNVKGRLLVDIKNSKEIADAVKDWKFLSYEKLCEKLNKEINNEESENVKNILNEYVKVLQNLQNIISKEFKSERKKLRITDKDFLDYEEINIANVLRKMSAKEFAEYLKENLDIYKENESKIEITTGFSRGGAIVDVYFIVNGTKDNWSEKVGISLQKQQYRYCVGTTSAKIDDVFNKYAEYKWFDKSDKNYTTTKKEKKQKLAPETYGYFASFLGEKEKYIYQHHKHVLENDCLGFEQLANKINEDLSELIKLIYI